MTDHLVELRETLLEIVATLDKDKIAQIPTTRDLFAVVDRGFEARITQYRWYANVSYPGHVYAVADINGKRVTLQRLVRHLVNEEKPVSEIKQVTFRNKCCLDCRASNLIERSGRQSVMRNRRGKSNSSSAYKGVRKRTMTKGSQKWSATIRIDEGDLFLGTHDDERYAAQVYDAAAFLFFSGSALLNFPEQALNMDAVEVVRDRYARFKVKLARKGD